MKKSAILFLSSLLFPALAWASDNSGNFGSSLPKELKSCDSYLAALDACLGGHCYKQNIFNSWLNGYITAYNAYVPDTFNIIGARDTASLNYWLANYCINNPRSTFDGAVGRLMIELAPQRTKEQPKN